MSFVSVQIPALGCKFHRREFHGKNSQARFASESFCFAATVKANMLFHTHESGMVLSSECNSHGASQTVLFKLCMHSYLHMYTIYTSVRSVIHMIFFFFLSCQSLCECLKVQLWAPGKTSGWPRSYQNIPVITETRECWERWCQLAPLSRATTVVGAQHIAYFYMPN